MAPEIMARVKHMARRTEGWTVGMVSEVRVADPAVLAKEVAHRVASMAARERLLAEAASGTPGFGWGE